MSMDRAMPNQVGETIEQTTETPYDQFLERARRHRSAAARANVDHRPESWADPDPAAITRLPDNKHPVLYVFGRQGGLPASQRVFHLQVRRTCERLQGLPGRSLTEDDLMRYPWHHVDADMAADFARLTYALYDKVTTRNDYISALRRLVTACHRAGLISVARRDEVLDELPTVAPGPSSRRRRLAQVEITALLEACLRDPAPTGARDAAIVALFATTGMRSCELVAINIDDWDRSGGTIVLRSTKNGSDHIVFVHPKTRAYLDAWLAVRSAGPGALFSWPFRYDGRPVATSTLRYWLAKRRGAAGVAPFGTHDFRRTFASTLLRTHDIALVGRLLNHRKPASTLIYDLASEDEQRAAIDGLGLVAPQLGDKTKSDRNGRELLS
jgi:integrase